MNNPFGTTRTVVARDHALIAPDSHVVAPLAGWKDTPGIILISPRMGAQFVQYFANMSADSRSLPMRPTVERFIYVLDGAVTIEKDGADSILRRQHSLIRGRRSRAVSTEQGIIDPVLLQSGGYAYLPSVGGYAVVGTNTASRLLVIERNYEPIEGGIWPSLVYGQEQDLQGNPFMGDPDAVLQVLLPTDTSFDMAVNIFTYQPGATLPFVETHIMEHGMMMIAGMGVYRISESYYPVQNEDTIWMAPYCPQWFVAMGKSPARYIYYKDVNRDPLEAPRY